jgi:hypothetical protein
MSESPDGSPNFRISGNARLNTLASVHRCRCRHFCGRSKADTANDQCCRCMNPEAPDQWCGICATPRRA